MKLETVINTVRENWNGNELTDFETGTALGRPEWTTVEGLRKQGENVKSGGKVFAVTKRSENEYSIDSFIID